MQKISLPTLCYVAPVYNAGLTISQTISSLRETARDDFERAIPIYLVDGGSSDASRYIAYTLAKKYGNIHFVSKPGSHPAARMNIFFDTCKEDVAMLFHADDLYNTGARVDVVRHMLSEGAVACGSQCLYAQDKIDAIANLREPYTGLHDTYPLSHEELIQSLPFWWSISLNTLTLDMARLRSTRVRYNYESYSFSADYDFTFRLAQLQRVINSPLVTTLTTHSKSSDGYANVQPLYNEARQIRKMIRVQTGLSDALGERNDAILDTLCYDQGGFSAIFENYCYRPWEYLDLASAIIRLSEEDPRFNLIKPYGYEICKMAVKLV